MIIMYNFVTYDKIMLEEWIKAQMKDLTELSYFRYI